MIFGAKRCNETTIKIGEACVKESTEENLLGITFDQSFSFKQHVKALCKKASQKLHALARISRCMDTENYSVNEGVRFMSFQLLSACLDVL